MRPPMRASEPVRRGVSMRTRGEATSAASRVTVGAALGTPGACGTVPGATCGVAPGCALAGGCCDWVCCCCCWASCLWRSSCGLANRYCHPIRTMPVSTMASSRFFWSSISMIHIGTRALHGPWLQPPQRCLEFLDDAIERQLQGGPPSDQHVIMTRPQPPGGRTLYDILEPPPHPIALDCRADLLRHGETDADRAIVGSPKRLQHESGGCDLATASRCQKIGPPPQSLHGNPPPGGRRQALSRLRPRARRAATTLRPPVVAIRARKPCRRLRTNLLG